AAHLCPCVFHLLLPPCFSFFFFNDPATPEIYTLSLHDALPIWRTRWPSSPTTAPARPTCWPSRATFEIPSRNASVSGSRSSRRRSEEHTSELQSRFDLVCRLLLEKKKKKKKYIKKRNRYTLI